MAMADTYTVVGSSSIVNGTEWNVSNTDNDMNPDGNGNYTLVIPKRPINAGTYEYKVIRNHDYENGEWGINGQNTGNAQLTISENGTYDIVFMFDTKEWKPKATAIKSIEKVSVVGSSTELFDKLWNFNVNDMALQADGTYKWNKETSVGGNVEYKVVVNRSWGNAFPSQNLSLTIPSDGTYNCEFTFNPTTYAVSATATPITSYVAQIGSAYYTTLQAAIDAAETGATINILKDYTLTTVTTSPNNKYNVNVNKSVTINGDGHTITSSEGKRALALTGDGNNITLKNLTVVNNKSDWCVGILNNPTVTLDATTIDGSGYKKGEYNQPLTIGGSGAGGVKLNVTNGSVIKTNDEGTAHYSIIAWRPAEITVTDSELTGWAAIYFKPAATGSTATVENCTLTSKNPYSGNSNPFGVFSIEATNVTVDVTNSTIDIDGVSNKQAIVNYGTTYGDCTGSMVNLGDGNKVTLKNQATFTFNQGDTYKLQVSGGLFSEQVPEENCVEGIIPTANTDETTSAAYPYTVKEGSYVAQIEGGAKYETLQSAIDAAETGATINILKDYTLTTVTTSPNNKYNVNVNKSVTINGDGHTITSSEGKRALALTGDGNNITLKNLTVVNNKSDWCVGILNNPTVTLDATTIDGSGYKKGEYNQPLTIGGSGAGGVKLNVTNGSVIKTNDEGTAHYSIIAWRPSEITVTDSKLIGWAGIYLKPDAAGSIVKIEGSEIVSKGIAGYSSGNSFAAIVSEGDNIQIEIKDTKINTTPAEDTYESLFVITGSNNVVKILGTTEYETTDMTLGAVTSYPAALFNNKVYFDDETKAAFAKYFTAEDGPTISDEKESPINLYPLVYAPEVYYYWEVQGGYAGVYTNFAYPFEKTEEFILGDGEYIKLMKDITLDHNIVNPLASGTINLLLDNYTITKGDYSLQLKEGQTIKTDKQTDIFSAVDEGYKVVETAVEGGYTYTVVAKEYVAQIGEGDTAVKYETLQDAINACETGTETTIKLLCDVTDGAGFAIPDGTKNKNIIIDFDGKSYNVTKDAVGSGNTKSQAMHFYSGNTLTLKNGTITSAATSEENKLKMMMQNYCDLTLDGMTIDCSNVNGGTYGTFTGADAYWSNKSVPVFNFNTGNATIKNTTITFRDGDNMGLCVDGGAVALGEGVVVNGPVSAVTGTVTITDGKYSGAITADKATIQISGGVFAEKPAEEYCADGYVATDNTDEATMAQYPYTVKSKEEAGVFELIDGKVYPYLDYNEDKPAESVSYFRTFKNQNWQSLYIPFDINDVTKLADKYEFAKVHMVAYETDDNGVVSSDRIRLYYIPITSGTIYANKPYLIKLKNKEDMNKQQEIKVEKTTLYKTQNINDDPMKCSTTNADYLFKGTYRTDEVKAVPNDPSTHFFGVGGGGISYISNNTLSSYRWYIKVDPKDVNYAKPTIEFVM